VKLVDSRDLWARWGKRKAFPRLVRRGPRLRGQAGIGAADCPQNYSIAPPSNYAALAIVGIAFLKYASSGVCQPSD
jgi:hypothetical protein